MSHSTLEPQAPAAARLVAVDGRTYPLESAHLLARAEGGFAASTLVQKFANPHTEPLEVVYTMPLPADGAVTGYTIRIGERVIRGEVQPRERASAAYKKALYEGKVAGLLEQQRPDTFEQKLGNVPPGTQVEVAIDVLHPLAFLTLAERPFDSFALIAGDSVPYLMDRPADPAWEYRFPTVVGVRYHGAPGRVPDQAALSPDRGATPARVQLTLTIGDGWAPQAWSSSHRISFNSKGVVVFDGDESLDRDVVVRWPAASEQVGVRVVEGAGLPGDDGRYALVTLVPPARPAVTYRRDLTVLLDASGSMDGLPLELAKVVIGDLLRSLDKGDRLELLSFANTVTRHTRGLVAMNGRSLSQALAALAGIEAGGGTEMESAVVEAMKATGKDAQHQVVLVTDGDVGFEAEVVARIAARQNVRLHVVGVGDVPNRSLTQAAAAAGRGLELLAGTHAEANDAARRLVNGTAGPVLTQVSVAGTAISGAAPVGLRDVFAGQPLMFTVELSREGGTFDVSGELAGSGHAWVHRLHVPAAGATDPLPWSPLPIGALHGREAVARLELQHTIDRHAGGMAMSGIDGVIEAVAMRHRIVSRRTSLVAIAEEPSVDPRAPRRRERLAVELPAGVSAEGVGLEFGGGGRFVVRAMSMAPGVFAEAASIDDRILPSDLLEYSRRIGLPWMDVQDFQDVEAADAVWAAPDLLLVEFVQPWGTLEAPTGQVQLVYEDEQGQEVRVRAEYVAERSTEPGTAEAGTLVRFAFRVPADAATLAGRAVRLEWTREVEGPSGQPVPRPARLRFDVPPGGGEAHPDEEARRT